jgi:hypothetical protein
VQAWLTIIGPHHQDAREIYLERWVSQISE